MLGNAVEMVINYTCLLSQLHIIKEACAYKNKLTCQRIR